MGKIIISDDDIPCQECGHIATPLEIKTDKIRMHKTRDGEILCECCYEAYLDAIHDHE
jgi:hypothetical protein